MRDDATIRSDNSAVRQRLGARLHGIHRRITHAREMLSPRTYVTNPFIRFGIAVAVGYQFGCRGHPGPETRHASRPETIVQSLIQTAVRNLATSVLRDVMREATADSSRSRLATV